MERLDLIPQSLQEPCEQLSMEKSVLLTEQASLPEKRFSVDELTREAYKLDFKEFFQVELRQPMTIEGSLPEKRYTVFELAKIAKTRDVVQSVISVSRLPTKVSPNRAAAAFLALTAALFTAGDSQEIGFGESDNRLDSGIMVGEFLKPEDFSNILGIKAPAVEPTATPDPEKKESFEVINETSTVIPEEVGDIDSGQNEEAQEVQHPTVSQPIADSASNNNVTCPKGWPVIHGSITQGPKGATSHYRLFPGEQAIDIGGQAGGLDVTATFDGYIKNAAFDERYGNFVDIGGSCNGTEFYARFAHLSEIEASILNGSSVTYGQRIGVVGATGYTEGGNHLHHSFFNLPMAAPNIPENLASSYCDSVIACGVSW